MRILGVIIFLMNALFLFMSSSLIYGFNDNSESYDGFGAIIQGFILMTIFGFFEIALSVYYSVGLKEKAKWFRRNTIVYWILSFGYMLWFVPTIAGVWSFEGSIEIFIVAVPCSIGLLQLISLNTYHFKSQKNLINYFQ